MVEFRYGPVELYLVGYEGDGPDAATFRALADLIDAGIVRLLDMVVVSKSDDGDELTVVEVDDLGPYGLEAYELVASGLTGAEDVEEIAPSIPPGTSAALVALELVFARELAEKVAASGGIVLRTERIPAPIVNVVAELAEAVEEEELEEALEELEAEAAEEEAGA